MSVSRRRRLPSRAAAAVRATPAGEPAELAYHLVAAGRLGEAGSACAAAAEVAMRRLAPVEACDLLARALEHTGDLLEHARLRCRLGEAWHPAGDVARAEQHLPAGVTALEAPGDVAAAAHHRLSLGRCCWERARYDAGRP